MQLYACLALVLLPWVDAATVRNTQFCSLLNKAVTSLREQRPATSYCSSYLKLSTQYVTTTLTSTSSITTTSLTTSTATSITTSTAIVTSISTPSTTTTVQEIRTLSSPTTLQNTLTATSTSITTITSIVATSTVYTNTLTQIDTTTVGTQTTTTTTSTTTSDLSQCTRPVFLKKRQLGYGKPVPQPKPKCLSGYSQEPIISRACLCLSIPNPTSTRTATKVTTKTITSLRTTTTTQVSTRFSTVTSTSLARTTTITVTISRTTTVVPTDFRTATATAIAVSTSTLSSTSTVSLDTTTTTTSTATTTDTTIATATVQRYSNFALLGSFNGQYGRIQDSVGGSGQGVYFGESNLGTAATFSFAGTKLYYNDQYIQSYAAASGNYYVVVERPFAQFGYYTDCQLNMPSFSGDGCSLDCQAGGGFFDLSTGNNVQNYGGAWGFQGSTDQFTVYAVGQT